MNAAQLRPGRNSNGKRRRSGEGSGAPYADGSAAVLYRCQTGADVALSLLGLVLLSPVLLAIGIAIVLDDGFPVLFTQRRVGRGKRPFHILKFRTMKSDTPHDKPTHLLEHPEQYITRVGKVLRKTSLDELPQLLNILTGSLHIVSYRPSLYNQTDLIRERDRCGLHQLRPGLTGWAQIHGRDELEIQEKAALDRYYLEHLGPAIDLKCFFGTFLAVFRQSGVVEGGTGAMERRDRKETR